MKAIYKSQFNFFDFFIILFMCSVFVGFPIWIYAGTDIIPVIAIFSTIIVFYFILCFSLGIYYFHEEYIEVLWIFRLFNRRKRVLYSDLKEVRYVNSVGSRVPYIVFVFNGRSFSRVIWPNNTCSSRRFKKRKEILFFLYDKGVSIFINNIIEKEEEAFKNIPNITLFR